MVSKSLNLRTKPCIAYISKPEDTTAQNKHRFVLYNPQPINITAHSYNYRPIFEQITGRISASGRCLVCKHGSHVTSIPKADWPGMKNKQLTATPC